MKLKNRHQYCRVCLWFKTEHEGSICVACVYDWSRRAEIREPCNYIKKKEGVFKLAQKLKEADFSWIVTT